MEPVDLIQQKLDELRSSAETTRREGNNYITTGRDIIERADSLDGEVEKYESFLIQIQLDEAERAARAQQAESAAKA